MNNKFLIVKPIVFILFSFCVVINSNAKEQSFVQSYESGIWSVKGNSFSCDLEQTFDGYAKLNIITVPDAPQKLVFEWLLSDREIKDIQIHSKKSDWQSKSVHLPEQNFSAAKINKNIAKFNADVTSLLRVIKQGAWIDTIVNFGEDQLRLTFTNFHSHSVVDEYQKCLVNLSPLSWNQARDSEILFDLGKRTVNDEENLKYLKDLARYVSLDKKVTKVLVDGHTDDVGSPLANRLLSKERADEVASRLVEFGLPKKLLEIRAHGQRYPVIKNSEKTGDIHNRRVLIRLFHHSD